MPDSNSSSDRIYVQEDGSVVAINYVDREFRAFPSDRFEKNEGLAELYDELEDEREVEELQVSGLDGGGIEVTASEIFKYDREAYDKMAAEADWDSISEQDLSS